jgi:hypothetical protein
MKGKPIPLMVQPFEFAILGWPVKIRVRARTLPAPRKSPFFPANLVFEKKRKFLVRTLEVPESRVCRKAPAPTNWSEAVEVCKG